MKLLRPLVYVTRDIERALGMEPVGDYFVISNDTAYGHEVQKRYPKNVYLIEGAQALDTYDLLCLPEVEKVVSDRRADVLVFQNTPRIERLAREKGWNLLNPSAELAKRVEEKISQVAWLGEDAALLPLHKITVAKDVKFEGEKFVLQWNHSHTGEGTHIIDSREALKAAVSQFPDRECRITRFVEGPVFTVNAVAGDTIVVGNPSYQITGLYPFSDLPFSTVGNDWVLPRFEEYAAVSEEVRRVAQRVAARLARDGWRGLFGIDAIYDEKAGKTFLLEINARQPASAAYESTLQGTDTIFEAHIASLSGFEAKAGPVVSGAQIVKRATNEAHKVDVAALREKGLVVIEYENSAHNKELFRIQSGTDIKEGIMKAHNRLNDLGEFIRSCIR
jgi:hypothetical protein